MAIRDVVVLNTTASRLETQQSTDTVRIKGSSSELLSVENSSGASVLSINTSTPSVTITGKLRKWSIQWQFSFYSSFGKISVTKLVGSAAGLTNTDKDGTITGSVKQLLKLVEHSQVDLMLQEIFQVVLYQVVVFQQYQVQQYLVMEVVLF